MKNISFETLVIVILGAVALGLLIFIFYATSQDTRYISKYKCEYTGYSQTTLIPISSGNITTLAPVTNYTYKCNNGKTLETVVGP